MTTASGIPSIDLPVVAALDWRPPVIWYLIGGSGTEPYGPGRIHASYGALDETFYQRRLEVAQKCVDLGCAKRVIFRETFGRWDPAVTQVAATGYQGCPTAMRQSWEDNLCAAIGWELIQYLRYGTGQYPANDILSRAESAVENLIGAATIFGSPVASTAIDGLPEVLPGSIDEAEITYLERLIRDSKSAARVYAEGHPEQSGDVAVQTWGHLPAMASWRHIRDNPPKVKARAERIVWDNESQTPAQASVFLRFCAEHRYTPAFDPLAYLKYATPLAELQKLAGRAG